MPLFDTIITVTLNPAIDRIMEIAGFHVGGHQRGQTIARVPAGKGVNVARALSELGVASIATGFVGRLQLEEYEASFRDSLVQPQFLAVDGRTRENVTVIDPTTATETHLRDAGLSSTPADLGRIRNKINLLAKPDRLFVFSGSLPTGMDASHVVELTDIVLSKGAKVAVDGPGDLLAALRDRALWLIKPNREELASMDGGPIERRNERERIGEDDIRRIAWPLTVNFGAVIVSCAAAGGYLFSRQSSLRGRVEFDPARVRSSVGCGDCLLAAFIASQNRGDEIESGYRYALSVATAAAYEIVPGRFDPAVIDDLQSKVVVDRVEGAPPAA